MLDQLFPLLSEATILFAPPVKDGKTAVSVLSLTNVPGGDRATPVQDVFILKLFG